MWLESTKRTPYVGLSSESGHRSGAAIESEISHEQTLGAPQQQPQTDTIRCRWREPSTASQANKVATHHGVVARFGHRVIRLIETIKMLVQGG